MTRYSLIPASYVYLLRDGAVLLQLRQNTGYMDGYWAAAAAGHVERGETAYDAAQREAHEELGITGLYPAHADRLEYRAEVGNGLIEHEVVDIYLAYARPGMTITPNLEEVAEIRWVGIYDLAAEVRRHPERFSKWLAIYLAEHMDRIFGALIRS